MRYPTEREPGEEDADKNTTRGGVRTALPEEDLKSCGIGPPLPTDYMTEVGAFRTTLPQMIGQRLRCS